MGQGLPHGQEQRRERKKGSSLRPSEHATPILGHTAPPASPPEVPKSWGAEPLGIFSSRTELQVQA